MTEAEIKELLSKSEVLDYLKEHLELDLYVDPCESISGYDITILGYDITAKVSLFDNVLVEDNNYV